MEPITVRSSKIMRMLRGLGLAGLMVLLVPYANGATYYVSQSAGSDANTGTSPSSPWKNAPGMSAYSGSGRLAPGDTVYFDRGHTWLVSGTQGLWLVGGVTYIGDSWGSGTKRATIKAASDLAAGVIRFRDDATFPTVLKGFDVDANGKVATGIDINSAFYLGPQTGATKRIQNVEVHNVWSSVAKGEYKYGIHVSNHGGNAGAVSNVEILDTVVHDTSRDAIALYPGDESADCKITNVTVRGSEAYNTGLDPDYCCGAGIIVKGHVQGAWIEFNYVHNTKGAAMFVNGNETNHFSGAGQFNIHIRDNIFTNATANGAILIYDGASGGDEKDLRIYGNIVHSSTAGAGLLIHNGLKKSISLRVYNNTFYNAPVRVESSTATFSTFEFANNIIRYDGGVPFSDPGRKITSHVNNIYFRPSGTLVSAGGSNYSSTNLASYEPSASSADPLFKSLTSLPAGFQGVYGTDIMPNPDGLAVQVQSYAVDRGLTLDSTYSSSVNSIARSSAWDIGAYELGGSNSPGPTTRLPAPTNLRVLQ
jgi:hypothetical protein